MGHQQWKPPTVRTKGCLLAVAMKAGVDADAVTNHFNGPYWELNHQIPSNFTIWFLWLGLIATIGKF
jgi:hypothetical protein